MKSTNIFYELTASLKLKSTVLTALLVLAALVADAQIGIGTTSPHASAQLDVVSDAKGVLVPRLTSDQRAAIATPADGLLVYDTNTKGFWYFKSGTGWKEINDATLTLPYTASANNAAPLFSLTNQGAGAVLEGLATGTGPAGRFQNTNVDNTAGNVIAVETNGKGNIPDNKFGNAASFRVNNNNSVAAAVRGEVSSIFGNFGAAGVFGVSSGTGGFAGLFHASNTSGNGSSVVAITDGNGNAITANAGKNGNGIETSIDGSGKALYAWVPTFALGRAGQFEIKNDDNISDVISVSTVGNGIAGNFLVNRQTGTSAAVRGEVNSMYANFGTAGVMGVSSGTGGFGGLFYSSNTSGTGPALIALTEGTGNGITANAGGNGNGIEATADGSGSAVYGWTPNFGTGRAARFSNFNENNGNPVVQVTNAGTGSAFLINHTGASGNPVIFQSAGTNVARINKAGKSFFNGGTQNSGADIAEAFDVINNVSEYEPGDVLSIATSKDRTIEKSAGAYSSLVLGVYATKPGVLLTEEHIDSDLSGKVPMGVVGVIPTKVCQEGGAIQRGDLLVTSSTPGVAMKADKAKVEAGQILGKALQNFDGYGIGKINVFVNVK